MSRRRFSLPTYAALVAVTGALGVIAPLEASAASPILLTSVQYDPPGTDTRTNAHLNQEYVTFRNTTGKAVSLGGWRIRDNQNHTFVFPASWILKPGATGVLRTGKGTRSGTTVYWNQGNYIWNNTGDTARFMTPAGKTFDTCSYKALAGRTRVAC
jgi:hypothetical protein